MRYFVECLTRLLKSTLLEEIKLVELRFIAPLFSRYERSASSRSSFPFLLLFQGEPGMSEIASVSNNFTVCVIRIRIL